MLTTRQRQSSESRENKQWLQELSAQECSGGWIEGNGGFLMKSLLLWNQYLYEKRNGVEQSVLSIESEK